MRIRNDWLDFEFKIDWLLLKESIKCGIGWHDMSWENDDGLIHCYCYKKVEECDLS